MALPSPRPVPRTRPIAGLLLAAAAAGCGAGAGGGTYEATEIRTLARPRTVPAVPLGEAERLRVAPPPGGGPRSHAAGAEAAGLAWDLPEGWEERPPSALRQGDFRVPALPDLECYVTVSPGDGGGVVPNVDRWRRQMGLPPMAAGEAEGLPRIPVAGRSGPLVDLRGTFAGMGGGTAREGWRMLGAVGVLPGATIFVKMTGPEAAVAAERTRFLALAASLRPGAPRTGGAIAPPLPAGAEDGGLPAGHPPVDGASAAPPPPPSPAALRWKVPDGWTAAPPRSRRVVTVRPDGHADVECYVTVLGGDGGGLAANINRWLDQVGLPPLDEPGIAALPQIPVLGGKAPLVEATGTFTGMAGEARTGFGLLGAIRSLGAESVFVKMTGPAEVLRAERARFLEFCASLER